MDRLENLGFDNWFEGKVNLSKTADWMLAVSILRQKYFKLLVVNNN
jgi:hypothetical protein